MIDIFMGVVCLIGAIAFIVWMIAFYFVVVVENVKQHVKHKKISGFDYELWW